MTPQRFPFLVEHALGSGGIPENAIADFREGALPAVLDYVHPGRERRPGRWAAEVASGLRVLRYIAEDGSISPGMRSGVVEAARTWVTEGPHDYWLVWAAMALATTLGDPELVAVVERPATDEDAMIQLLGDGHRRLDRMQEIAR